MEEALNTRELFKIKVQESAPLEVRDAGEALAERVAGLELVQTIGRTAIFYRPHPEKPEIKLPG